MNFANNPANLASRPTDF